jgi:hypothetical protein
MTVRSPCHNRDMYGEEMLMCSACGTWYKPEDLNDAAKLDQLMKMFGLDSSPKQK